MSKHILVLARGESRNYRLANGKPVFCDLDARVSVFTDKKNKDILLELDDIHAGHIVRWRRHQAILELAKEIHRVNPLCAVAAFSEEDVELAASIRREIGISGTDSDTAKKFRDKVYMKEMLAGAKTFRNPHFKGVFTKRDTEEFLDKYGKVVLKPRDSQGSKGVAIIENNEQIEEWFADDPPLHEFQLEEFVDGVLYHINSLVQGERAVFHSVAPYIPEMGNIDYYEGRPFVSVIETEPKVCETLEAVANEVITLLGLQKGVTHLEVFLNNKGEIVFCEVAARAGGGGIVAMIEEASGVNLNRELLKIELDEGWTDSLVPIGEERRSCGLIGIRNHRFGSVTSIPSLAEFKNTWIHRSEINSRIGMTALPASHCTDFSAFFIVSGKSYQETLDRILSINMHFNEHFKVESL
ncbi:ATP-grasp domain-containing protein [Pseudobacteriovorax antillogorgiicola]|uniref:ATP-grasp domain-containing protein n=1 Tax=Pseudobacteriovorax antillogorgiicola TaxID=1513793 RepID=A0A1Y6BZG4_9BACT|nr:ATP-grasp domain-containing protein [Pseudobacteriovorax antillogorgiicola]TCS51197.1 ATP-grasp domain-containing protein [Pseudobacteriovorax antillogorgiicola]SMF37472.1 ATP-grasp domain-containing protein [Pseudobacteriovorax antillogorgiicola]